jgi:hypothetical protein
MELLLRLIIVLAILMFFALTLAVISRLNSLTEQIDRIIAKLSQASSDEKALANSAISDGNSKTE